MDRPTYEAAKKVMLVGTDGRPIPGAKEPEPEIPVAWDKSAPQGPPEPMERAIPGWFQGIHDWLKARILDESLALDLCLERAIQIVQFNHDRGLVGIDHFADMTGGQAPNRTSMVAMSIPVAVELYRQVLATVGARKEEFEAVVRDAQEKRAAR